MLSIRGDAIISSTLRSRLLGLTRRGFALVCWPGGRYGRYAADALDGFAMLYTGLVLLASLATCLSPTRGLKAITTTRTSSTCCVNCRAGRDPAGECQPSGVSVLGIELISLPLFGLVGYAFRRNVHWKPVSNTPSFLPQRLLPAVWYGAGVCAVWRPVVCRVGKNLGDGMLNEPLLLAGFG